MTRWRLWQLAGLLVPASLVGAAAAAKRWLRAGLPSLDGVVQAPGLAGTVEIHRDRWGVPHIYARDDADLFFAQGYVHAQDRLWQMEVGRRLAQGRLAEVFGPEALEIDRFFRRLGLHRISQASLELSSAAASGALESYSRGVNAAIASAAGRWPLEFRLARFEPGPWTPLDSLTFGRYMAWILSDNWIAEFIRGRFIARLGLDDARALEPAVWRGVSAEQGRAYAEGAAERGSQGGRARWGDGGKERVGDPFSHGPGGSNAWVIAGSRATTGRPLLANDPHLPPSLPSTWYEVHLSGGDYHVAGASVPGLPGVVIGHNEHIAWGVTAAQVDVQDLVVERLHPRDPHRYLCRGEWRRGEVVNEAIAVRGRVEPVSEDVLITRHGPVLTPTPVLPGETRSLALRSVVLEPSSLAESLLDLNRAASWEQFRAALAAWPAPPLHFVYADVEGNIGYQLAARAPVRGRGAGLAPVPGWTGEHDWQGWVDFADLPSTLNPPEGYVASANNDPAGDGYPHQLSREWCAPYRYQRICQLVTAVERCSPEYGRAMQLDLRCLPGLAVATYLDQHWDRDGAARTPAPGPAEAGAAESTELAWAMEVLRAWDGVLGPTSVAGALYEAFKLHFLIRRFGPALGDLLPWLLGQGPHPVVAPTSNYIARVSEILVEALRQEGDDPGVQALVRQALLDALAFLRRRLGPRRERWQWGRLHQLVFHHSLGSRRPLNLLFNLGPLPVGGDADTLCQSASLLPSLRADSWSPSYRQILDLADWDSSVAVLPTGQSGHRASAHYADHLALWRTGQYHPLPFTRQAVLAQSVARLRLERAGG